MSLARGMPKEATWAGDEGKGIRREGGKEGLIQKAGTAGGCDGAAAVAAAAVTVSMVLFGRSAETTVLRRGRERSAKCRWMMRMMMGDSGGKTRGSVTAAAGNKSEVRGGRARAARVNARARSLAFIRLERKIGINCPEKILTLFTGQGSP